MFTQKSKSVYLRTDFVLKHLI